MAHEQKKSGSVTGSQADALPHPMVFFMDDATRRRVVRRLRDLHPKRTEALLRALGLAARDGEGSS